MFATKSQFFVFVACVAIGGLGGVLFTAAAFIKLFIKRVGLKILPDIAAFCAFTLLYVRLSFILQFPSYRLYMAAGALIGLLLYMKSFNHTLALLMKKLYNIIIKKFAALKTRRQANRIKNVKRNERRKHLKKRRVSA